MIGELIQLVFDKVKEDGHASNKNAIAIFIADKMESDYKIGFTTRTYSRYYDRFVLNQSNNAGEPNIGLKNAFSHYLGYVNYEDFIKKNKNDTPNKQLSKQNKENKLEETQYNTLINPRLIKPLLFLGIVALLLYIISVFTGFFKKEASTNNNITIENLNTATNYYFYYDKNDKVVLLEEAKKPIDKETQPLTRTVLNTFFYQQGKDTTTANYKVLRANYFNKGVLPIIDKEDFRKPIIPENNTATQEVISEKDTVFAIEKHKIAPNNTTLNHKKKMLFTIQKDSKIDFDILPLFQKKYQDEYQIITRANKEEAHEVKGATNYNFRKSTRNYNRIICDLTLQYTLTDTKNNTKMFSFSKKVTGTGFTKETAKENALKKMNLFLQ